MIRDSRLSKWRTSLVRVPIVGLAILSVGSGIAGESRDASDAAETHWNIVQAYIDMDAAWQAKTEEMRGADQPVEDQAVEERHRRLQELRAKRPDIVPAIGAARAVVEAGGVHAVDAARFLVERPLGLSPTADQDMDFGLQALKSIVGPDWTLVETHKRRYEEWTNESREIRDADIADDEKRKRTAALGQKPKDPAAIAAALAIAELGRAHEKGRQAAEFLIYPGAGKTSPEVALMAARSLFEHFPDYGPLPFVLMSLGFERFGPRESVDAFFADVAANANNPVVVATARYYSATGLMSTLNGGSLPPSERAETRRRALEVATGLSVGVEDVEFVGSRYDLGPGPATLAQAEASLVHAIRHATVGGTVADETGRRLDGSEEKLSAYAGKVLLLNFWGTWCGPCVAALPELRQLATAYPKDRFEILAISNDDDVQTVVEFMEANPMPWAHWHVGASSELVRRNWYVRSWPTYVVVDSSGEIFARSGSAGLEAAKAIVGQALQNATASRSPGESGGRVSQRIEAVESVARTVAPEPLCMGDADGEPCWRSVDGRPACHVWNPVPSREDSFEYEGSADCANGKLSGTGTARFRWQEDGEWKWWEVEGTYEDGKAQGHWVGLFNSGVRAEGPYVDSTPHGHWVWKYPNGTQSEGPLVRGIRHGRWIDTFPSGERSEGPYANGQRHGRWVLTYPNGSRHVSEWVNGELQSNSR